MKKISAKRINLITILILCAAAAVVIFMIRPADEEKMTQKGDVTVKVEIDCSAVLEDKNYRELSQAVKDSGLLDGGAVLADTRVQIAQGETAFDALKLCCEENDLKLDAQSSGSSVYIYGIGGLCEGSCTKNSGWVYSIDGTEPDKPINEYVMKDGGSIRAEFIVF